MEFTRGAAASGSLGGGMSTSPTDRHASTPAELQEQLAAARSGWPYLQLRDGDGRQVIILLDASRPRLTIGRRPESDVALPWDHRTSRLHAELERVGSDWVVVDDGLSTNGTWVGDHRLTGRRRLHDGDVIRAGDSLIAFCAPQDAHGSTLALDVRNMPAKITPAQKRVLVAMCRPRLALADDLTAPPSNQQLASELVLSVDAIKTHLRSLFEAFKLDDVQQGQKRVELVDRAIRMGAVTERDL